MGVGAYGAKWAKFYGDLPVDSDGKYTVAGLLWARGLAGFDRKTILRAFERSVATGDEWPPNLPQMRKACAGIPALRAIAAELANHNARRSPFAALVWSNLDAHRYRLASSDVAERMLLAAYELAVEHVMRGGTLPDVCEELTAPEPPKRTPASPETARRCISELSARLHVADAAAETA
jgi:hypothetical protein